MITTTISKVAMYRDLCDEVKDSYIQRTGSKEDQKDKVYMLGCNSCQEINLWTYWQGRGNVGKNIKILLVGQDWGCTSDSNSSILMNNIAKMNQGINANYLDGVNVCITDKNLIALFESIGYKDISRIKYDDLFFTNLCLGYRNKGTSGGLKAKWINRDRGYFRSLVEIIRPEVIICLGKDTFKGVTREFGVKTEVNKEKYPAFIEKRDPAIITLEDGKTIATFALAHCGAMGTVNRNKGLDIPGNDITVQKTDWNFVKDYILYPFKWKSVEELAKMANAALENFDGTEMTEEEMIEEDAEFGYFPEDD